MLKHTFLHLPGIGAGRERALWQDGVLTWDDFERRFPVQRTLFPSDTPDSLASALTESREALRTGNFDYFAAKLPKQEHYRIAMADPRSVVFVDIETTGLSLYYDKTTLIGASNFDGYHLYVAGRDLRPIAKALANAKCVITFNGTLFDLKFLQKEFPQLRFPKAHVDLRFLGLRFGLSGSQKSIERTLGLHRPIDVENMKGEAAPLLWYRYSIGDKAAGKRLIEYNHSDIEGMKFVFDYILENRISNDELLRKRVTPPKFYQASRAVSWASSKSTQRRDRVYLPPFRGSIGPKVTYDHLVTDVRSKSLNVVGIDLSGSEERATGWCLLNGRRAATKLVWTNKEIIEETIAAHPDLVSIDSPLSLPKGRIKVSDDDPGRDKYGIMRECERILKKRGVNVYPSLINSMQRLTDRGIRLAKMFRSQGLPVIESYPGAAQDIMGIPRKRAGLDYLKKGLDEFGIRGEFLNAKVSHDEADAITSSVVGLFFWSGKFEGLGNDDEEYLIIPDLEIPPDPWRKRVVIGISGPIASGKTTGARYLEKAGFVYGRYSEVLADILNKQGKKPTRENLQAVGDRVNRRPGQRWLSEQLVRKLPKDRNLVIDGLRFPEDHAFLVESFGPAFIHIHVSASEKHRKARYVKDGHSVRDFDRAIRHPVEKKLPLLSRFADLHISNDGSRRAYLSQLGSVAGVDIGRTSENRRKSARIAL